ncbi:hypothetical protein ACE939_05750 [Aquimarina sp. W85]|uniref:hypothetical protein n=1 Tax=Aquimarina rhodophyticola TaxID=3342246 RepID=UPI00366AC0C7
MKRYFVLICLISIFFISKAQELPSVIPAAPGISTLSKFVDVPVGHFTGVPQISIPITSVTQGEISFPINLNYHASGIRVDEIASPVGLGWSLNAGGLVSRSVRGIPDDDISGYINTTITVPYFMSLPQSQINNYFDQGTGGRLDFESDVYTFILPNGTSGKFYFNQNGDVLQSLNNRDITIEYVKASGRITKWKITTPDGMIYHLGVSKDGLRTAKDRTTTTALTRTNNVTPIPDTPEALSNYVSTWRLIDIENTKGDNLKYEYESRQTSFYSLGNQREILWQLNSSTDNCQYGISKTYLHNSMKTNQISAIRSKNFNILFNYNLDRLDLKGDKALSGVRVLDAAGGVVEEYKLTHDYFTSTRLLSDLPYGDLEQRRKRLYLKEFIQIKGAIEDQKYSFDYNTDDILPDRLSMAQDFWGYYNGQSNRELIPEINYYHGAYANPHLGQGGIIITNPNGANRKVSERYSKACMLRKITYPTKGSTEYLMESNRVFGDEDFLVATKTISKTLVSTSTIGDSSPVIEKAFDVDSESTDFATNNVFEYRLTVSSEEGDTYEGCYELGEQSLDCPIVSIYKKSGQFMQGLNKSKGSIYLPDGDYKLQINNESIGFGTPRFVTIHIYGYAHEAQSKLNALFGGMRVHTIISRDNNDVVISKRKFDYNNFDDPNKTSGKALNPPTYVMKGLQVCDLAPGGDSVQAFANPIFSLSNEASYSVGYTNVAEYFEGKENGKTEYTFSFAAPGYGIQSTVHNCPYNYLPTPCETYPNTPIHDLSHRRGLLLKRKDFSYDNNVFKPIKEVVNVYDFDRNSQESTLNLSLGSFPRMYNEYTNLSEKLFLKKETGRSYYYNADQTHIISTEKEYFYESYPKHSQITKIETTNSNDNKKITKIYYPDDVETITSLGESIITPEEFFAIQRLKKEGVESRVAQSLQTEILYKGLRTIQRTNFKTWHNKFTAPKSLASSKSFNPLEARVLYHDYDDYGNPLEVSKANGNRIIYIWGYNNTYVIAKIENATYEGMPTEVVNLINQIMLATNTENSLASEMQIREQFDSLRNHNYFENSQVVSYTYDPLVGVTSIVDASGDLTTYHYDNFNRLKYSKDSEGKLLTKNKYKYKNK